MAGPVRFTTVVELHGGTATGLPVPDDAVEALEAGRRPAVHVRLAGHAYRSTVAARGGRYLLPLSAEQRAATGLAAGDEVEVELELDTEPRTVEVPDDLAAALAGAPGARDRFDALTYSAQLRHVLAVTGAKAPATRERRVATVVTELAGG